MPTVDSVDSRPAAGLNIKERIERLNLVAQEEARASGERVHLNGDSVHYDSDQHVNHNHNNHQQQPGTQLISRTQKQSTTQQVTTVTKVYSQVQHIAPDGQLLESGNDLLDGVMMGGGGGGYIPADGYLHHHLPPADSHGVYQPHDSHGVYQPPHDSHGVYQPPHDSHGVYQPPADDYGYLRHGPLTHGHRGQRQGYPDRPPTPPSASERSDSPPQQLHGGYAPPASGYDELDSTLVAPHPSAHHVHTKERLPPPPPHQLDDQRPLSRMSRQSACSAAVAAPRAVFDEVIRDVVREQDLASGRGDGLHFRDPDLHEVINFLSNANNVVRANAAAYLQHLCYMDDPMKQKTRALGGIPPLVTLLAHEIPEVHRNACGALRNLSYGRQNDENKRAINNAGGIPALIRLLRKTPENEIKELVTGILWNLSSSEDLKRIIIDDGLTVLVNYVVIPHSGWNRGSTHAAPVKDVFWSTVFRNATGVLRNASSAGEYARRALRECEGLVDALLLVIRSAIGKSNIDNKCVENCVCVLRNLSYRCQEVDDPNYDRQVIPQQNRPPGKHPASSSGSGDDNSGCFGGRKQRDGVDAGAGGMAMDATRNGPVKGMYLLWQPDIVQPYLKLLSDCSNPETLEAAAGALQNLAACYWQPSVDIRAAVRKEKGLPILVELLRMEADRVVCAVATALRNLAIDQRNKELIGKYAMRDLVQKLPGGGQQDTATSDDTVAAVLATLNEVIKKSAEFCRSLFELDGVKRLLNVTRHRNRYSSRVIKFAGQVLFSMWMHQELREAYKKAGFREADFVTKSVAARNTSTGPGGAASSNNTLNRPMASQGGTRYEDRTMPRGGYGPGHQGGPGYPPHQPGGEPVYAQVNRERKRQQQEGGPARVWGFRDPAAAGDSWV